MDIFDQYLYDELITQYAKPNLSPDDYDELYQRFCNVGYLAEVKPYLLTMRFFGLGTVAEKEAVLSELKILLKKDNHMLKGLYYDLLLTENSENMEAIVNLRQMINEGYTNIYTKEKSRIEKVTISSEEVTSQEEILDDKFIYIDEDIVVDHIIFECNGYSGLYFAAGEVDYLCAKVFIKPLHGKKHIKVCSQIFIEDDAFSKKFISEFDIDANTRWFRTLGWGNKTFDCYYDNIYKWVIEIDGKTTFSQEFRMYNGTINNIGPNVHGVKLFASKSNGALETDYDCYKTAFDHSTLEFIYFKFLIDTLEENMNVQVYIKIISLEDSVVFRDICYLQNLQQYWNKFWYGVGFTKPGNWKKGLYQYIVHIGDGEKYDGIFSVY